MITCGRFEIHSIITGPLLLDGGAMFGVVPKVLWERKHKADEQNRVSLATRTLLAIDRSARRVVLVDTGAGNKWDTESAQRFGVKHDGLAIQSKLESLGLTVSDVTDVVVTHLHFDHNGGLADWVDQPGGPTRLRYPQATHWIHAEHLRHAKNPTLKDRASFFKQDYEALEKANVLRAVEGNAPSPPFEGAQWLVSWGHTVAQLLPLFLCDKGSLLFTGDMFPTATHLHPPWLMAYDLQPLVTIDEKTKILKRCREEGLLLAFPHDPATPGVKLDASSPKPAIDSVLDL